MSINMVSLESLLKDFQKAFYEDDFPAQLSIHQKIKSDPSFKPLLHEQATMEYLKYKSDLKVVDQCKSLLQSEGWSTARESPTIKIESRGGGSNFLSRSTLLINSNVFQVLAVISEFDLVTTWVKAIKEVVVYEQPTKTRVLLKYIFDFPWPLSNRHCMLEFYAVPMDKALMIVLKTPETDKYLGYNVPRAHRGETRMRVNIGCLYVEYVSEFQTKLTIMTSCDANIAFLPAFIINFGTKHLLYYMMEEIRTKITNIQGSIYEERINTKKEFYDYLRKMIGIYIH